MGKRAVQLNIRTEANVAEALREEALRRDIALGDVLEELLVRARASTETGVWVALPPEVESALKGVAAARGLEPSQVLGQMVAGQLRDQLLSLAANLRGPAGGGSASLDGGRPSSTGGGSSLPGGAPIARPTTAALAGELHPDLEAEAQPRRPQRNPAQGLPVLGDEDEDEEVGIFTVFE